MQLLFAAYFDWFNLSWVECMMNSRKLYVYDADISFMYKDECVACLWVQ